MTATGRVFLIGSGPGDPGLITVRGIRLLGEADVVVYDRAAEAALRWARPEAERIAAGAPAEHDMAQDAISMLLAEKARDGHLVARLKWGDPYVFDSGAKEAIFLHEQGVPFEVVPGVPSAVGASAYAGLPVTYPEAGDAVVLIRGQEDESSGMPELDWSALARLDGTFTCHASGRQIPLLLRQMLDAGFRPETSAALVYHGTLASQQTVTGTIDDLLARASTDGSADPALLVVGSPVGLRDHLRWFDSRPLFGRRIVLTRSPEQAAELVDRLESLGASAIQAPTFRLTQAEDPESVDRAAASIDQYRWVVFESAGCATRFLSALISGPRDLRAFGQVQICAIGPSTADRLIAAGIKPDVAAPEAGVESVGDAIEAHDPVAGQRVLVVRPEHLRDAVGEDLAGRGALVTDLVAYATQPGDPDSPAAQALYRELLDGTIDAVTFTSPTGLRRFAMLVGEDQAVDLLNTTLVAVIGPVTAAAAREMGIKDPLVPTRYTVEGLVDLLTEHFRAREPV